VLTVGWNTELAKRLGVNVGNCLCVQGYKGDPERRIGLVGQVAVRLEDLLARIHREFGGACELAQEGLSDEIHIVAIMNAFNGDEVHRVLEMAQQIAPEEDGRHMLYLTGQPRVAGLEAAKALGMSVACVGHRQAEDWGIRYIAAQLRATFPKARVEEVYEEEIPVVREKKQPSIQETTG
jgi:putative NIF3 family GTP cyclohydrolase 1 type 2